ncbi:hypothetical protein SESBI_22449 [Sesbania bispinosa]|nr:hypothetical protein SESBI_22449 [Sesbania bispinosa]
MKSVGKEMEGINALMKTMLNQQNSNVNEEEVDNMMTAALGCENSVDPPSSTSSYVPHQE